MERQPSVKTDIAYTVATLGGTAIWSVLQSWLLYFYLPPQGQGVPLVVPALYGATMLAVRAIDVAVGPLIGYWSDQTRGRWGRRLPFMFFSGLPALAFFVLLWRPPVGTGESPWNLFYLIAVMLLYSIAYAVYQIPYAALLPELALTDRRRVRMSSWYAGFQVVGMIVAAFAGLMIDEFGYLSTALVYAGLALPLLYVPIVVLHERPGRQISVQERLGFWQSIRATFGVQPFRVFAVSLGLFWTAMRLVQAALPFIATEVLLLSKADTIYLYIPAVLVSLACYPLVAWLVERLGKWPVFAGSLLASAVVLPGVVLIGDWLPGPPMAWAIVWITLQSVATSGAAVLPPTFTAEITDQDELVTGQRREGSYCAALSQLDQVVDGVASALLALLLILGRSRSAPHGPLGVRLVGIVGGGLMLIGFLAFRHYRLGGRSAWAWDSAPST